MKNNESLRGIEFPETAVQYVQRFRIPLLRVRGFEVGIKCEFDASYAALAASIQVEVLCR